jgi:hypothetical protein
LADEKTEYFLLTFAELPDLVREIADDLGYNAFQLSSVV